MRALLVGDVHATPEEIGDCRKLVDYVISTAVEQKIKHIIFMGDLCNTHAVLRVEVLAFWREAFQDMRNKKLEVTLLVGNHDYAGEGLKIHSLMAFEDLVSVIDEPMCIAANAMAIPYMADREQMVSTLSDPKWADIEYLLCHQTFEGAEYDNGMYAPDGLDQDLLPQKFIISGHIHKPAQFGKVTYIGAPRWRTLSDANIERSIVLFDFDTGERKDFSTGNVCRQIRYVEDTPTSPAPKTLDPNIEWRIDIKGPAEYIETRKAELAGTARLRTFKTDKAAAKVRESEGVSKAFYKFLDKYNPKYGTPKERLVQMAQEML